MKLRITFNSIFICVKIYCNIVSKIIITQITYKLTATY